MKKQLLFTMAFLCALTFGFAQTSISFDTAGAADQEFTVGNQDPTDPLRVEIADLTSVTGSVTSSGGFVGFNAAAITDDTTTGTFTFTLSTDSATSINKDLSFEIQKRKGIITAGTVSVSGYPDVPFSFGSEGSAAGVEIKSIDFGEIALITGTDLTVVITLTSMMHVESTQVGTFRLRKVTATGVAIPPMPTEISYDAVTAGDQTFTVGIQTTDDLGEEIAMVTSATGTVATNNSFIGINSADTAPATVTSGSFTFTLTTDSATSIDRYLTLDFGKRPGCTVEGTVTVTGYPDLPFSFITNGDSGNPVTPGVVNFGAVSLITGTDLTVVVNLTSMTSVDNTTNAIFRLENVLVNENPPLSVTGFNLVKSISVYPNPVTNSFQIDSNRNIQNVALYNITGRLIKTFGAEANYDISDLATGIYIANVNTELGSKTIKIIKK